MCVKINVNSTKYAVILEHLNQITASKNYKIIILKYIVAHTSYIITIWVFPTEVEEKLTIRRQQ